MDPLDGPISPLPSSNQVDVVGRRTAVSVAQSILDRHKAGLESRRGRDLISEKLLLHIDGSGTLQFADILNGSRIVIPHEVSEYRQQENLLRLVVDNAVAHHTTMPLRYYADATPDREARKTALVDSLVMNDVAQTQNLNGLFADALYLAEPAGFCPVHCYWREDNVDQHEPLAPTDQEDPMVVVEQLLNPSPGQVDCFMGNPFDTVFDHGARRDSVHWATYGRVFRADMVRERFAHVPGVAGLEGTTRLPSASMWQRIAASWRMGGLGTHGSPIASYRRDDKGEELLYVIFFEVLPGVMAEWPEGRLQIIAVPGTGDVREGKSANPLLIADQKLPASDFSFTNFYSDHRSDDVHGKPWVEDLDELQVSLNIALSKQWELANRMVNAPFISPGGAIADDMMNIGGYDMIEVEPTYATWRPQLMKMDDGAVALLERIITDKRNAIFRAGGYQAASRGESAGSRQAYRAIVALQQADNSIHGPVNMRFQRSACDYGRRVWKQFKSYGDVPWLLQITGDEYAHLAKPYVDKSMLSRRPPKYKLVNAFGPSPELRAQEVLELMRTVGADGVPFLTTSEARRLYPNPELWYASSDPKAVARRRAKTVCEGIFQVVDAFRKESGFDVDDMANPMVQQAGQFVGQQVEKQYPMMRDDDLQAHLESLSEITQDETADSVARWAARMRQDMYYQWQAQMAAAMAPAGTQVGGGQAPQQRLGPRSIAQQGGGTGGQRAETPTPVATAR